MSMEVFKKKPKICQHSLWTVCAEFYWYSDKAKLTRPFWSLSLQSNIYCEKITGYWFWKFWKPLGTIHMLRNHIFRIFGPPSPLRNHVFSTENNQKLAFSDPPSPPYKWLRNIWMVHYVISVICLAWLMTSILSKKTWNCCLTPMTALEPFSYEYEIIIAVISLC